MTKKLEQKTFSTLKTIDARFARAEKKPSKSKASQKSQNLCELCDNLRELCVRKTLRKTLLYFVKQIP